MRKDRRALALKEAPDRCPVEPVLQEVPDEPDLEFTRIIHTDVRYCGKCRASYSGLYLRERVALFVAHGGRAPFTATWAQTETPCPHCLTKNHSETQGRIRRENRKVADDYGRDRQAWQRREDARNNVLPHRKPRRLNLQPVATPTDTGEA